MGKTIELPDNGDSMREINSRTIAEQGMRESIDRSMRDRRKREAEELIDHYKNGGTFDEYLNQRLKEDYNTTLTNIKPTDDMSTDIIVE